MRIVESFEGARRRHAQLHDGLHREVQQHRPRQGGQLQNLRTRVRDPDAARLELRASGAGRTSRISTGSATTSGSTRSRPEPRSRSTWTRARWSGATPKGAKNLLKEIAEGTDLGKAIGNGAVARRAPAEAPPRPSRKGPVDCPPGTHDPPQGSRRPPTARARWAPTTPAGLVVDPGQAVEDIAQASQEAQILNTAIDSSGFCQFLMPSIHRNQRVLLPLLRREGVARADRRYRLAVHAGRVGVQSTSRFRPPKTTRCRTR